MNALEKIREITQTLSPCGIDAPVKEAERLVIRATGGGLAELYGKNPELSDDQARAIDDMVRRRRRREPLQYITGSVEFLGMTLQVGRGVLIPRPETELMAEYAIELLKSQEPDLEIRNLESGIHRRTTVLDLCTGSGCLALALARAFPKASVWGVDISASALNYARDNARLNGISNVSFVQGSLFDPLDQDRSYDFIISNPPYIKTGDIPGLQREIRDWEPVHSLDGGPDGLDFYREIIPAAAGRLKDGAVLMVEVGEGHAEDVAAMYRKAGYGQVMSIKDYAGIERIVEGRWTK